QRNPNPYDGEAFYNLGLALFYQSQWEDAYDAFYKSTWNDAWQHAAFFRLAQIVCRKKDFDNALYLINRSLVKNAHSHSALHLKTAILRHLRETEKTASAIENALTIDPFNYGCLFESYLLSTQENAGLSLNNLYELAGYRFNTIIEYVIDYRNAGLIEEAIVLLEELPCKESDLAWKAYYLGWLYHESNNAAKANEHFMQAAGLSTDYMFAHKLEDLLVFSCATS